MVALLWSCATAHALDTVIGSFDGTRIVTHFYAAKRSGQSPTVLVGPGYGKPGNTSPESNLSDVIGAHTLRSAGYNSSRGTRVARAARAGTRTSTRPTSRRATSRR